MKIEEALQLAAETAGVGTWNLFVLEQELRSSPKCREIFGFSPDAAFGYRDFLSVLHPDDREMVEAMIAETLDPQGSGLYDVEYRIIRPDETVRWVSGKGRAFFEGNEGERKATHFIGTVLDLTESKKMQEALVEAEKLALTGRLAASIAHEIRNPVDAAINLLYLLRGETSKERRLGYLQQAESELQRVSEIATNTLRFYSDPSGITCFDLGELVQSVLTLFSEPHCIGKDHGCHASSSRDSYLRAAGRVAASDREPGQQCVGRHAGGRPADPSDAAIYEPSQRQTVRSADHCRYGNRNEP